MAYVCRMGNIKMVFKIQLKRELHLSLVIFGVFCKIFANSSGIQVTQMTDTTTKSPSFIWENRNSTNLYYMFVTTPLSWYDARDYCRANNGNLTSVTSQEEQDYLAVHTSFYIDHCWIGLTAEREVGVWQWEDGSPVTYTNWDHILLQPDTWSQEYCTVMGKLNFPTWHDVHCFLPFPFVCKRTPVTGIQVTQMTDTTTKSPSFIWENRNGTNLYYMFVTTPLSWYDARDYCRANNGNLTSVTSQEEQDYLAVHTSSFIDHCWIGLTDEREVGVWQWEDETPVTYTNWDHILLQPDTWSQEYCTVMGKLNFPTWHDVHCFLPYPFVCKRTPVTGIQVTQMTDTTTKSPSFIWENRNSTNLYYMFVPTRLSWYDARDYCRANNGNLTSVTSQEEQDYLASRMSFAKDCTWIGFSDESGIWKWEDGSLVKYTNWDRNVSDLDNRTNEHCAIIAIYNVAMWQGASCKSSYQFMCKRTGKGLHCFIYVC
ncbi:C-type mannose receptor 2-like isoform X2 [Physella acuta]|uniref:C-type mannose receptor 2-like isoform X2 n=1 Tax=Physella acuta TaxID=109671 RepID=UPI0027DCC68D|nr:C-type mannose receptor 2-like isoform X2 [Physella acuta]